VCSLYRKGELAAAREKARQQRLATEQAGSSEVVPVEIKEINMWYLKTVVAARLQVAANR